MSTVVAEGIRVVDGLDLAEDVRELLQPDAIMGDGEGRSRRLPRYFFEVDSWKTARETELTAHFALWEFIHTDLREAALMHTFPRYVPCAVTLLAACLELFRLEVGALVHIAANGGYRSPGHALSTRVSPHLWGCAANIYRIGDSYMDDRETIERYREIARRVLPGINTRPYGSRPGGTIDHLHIDLGFVTVEPPLAAGEEV